MIKQQVIKQLSSWLRLVQYHEIPVLELEHAVGRAKISLQGGQLFSWQPAQAKEDMLWLSEIEPFNAGNAIRGGIPVCYPWFGRVKEPPHGTARIRLWQLCGYQAENEVVTIELGLFDAQQLIEAKLVFRFDNECEIRFTHYGEAPAQLALHSYFKLSDIGQVSVENLPTECFNSLTQAQESAVSPRKISENVDCIYRLDEPTQRIVDFGFKREIEVHHINADEAVLWNPWHKATGGMSETGYRTMLCLETARLSRLLSQGETMAVRLREVI